MQLRSCQNFHSLKTTFIVQTKGHFYFTQSKPVWSISIFSWSKMCFWITYSTSIYGLLAYLLCTGTGPGQVQGTGPGAMVPNILYRNVHTDPRQGKEPGPIVSYCAGPVPCTCPGPVPVQCEQGMKLPSVKWLGPPGSARGTPGYTSRSSRRFWWPGWSTRRTPQRSSHLRLFPD